MGPGCGTETEAGASGAAPQPPPAAGAAAALGAGLRPMAKGEPAPEGGRGGCLGMRGFGGRGASIQAVKGATCGELSGDDTGPPTGPGTSTGAAAPRTSVESRVGGALGLGARTGSCAPAPLGVVSGTPGACGRVGIGCGNNALFAGAPAVVAAGAALATGAAVMPSGRGLGGRMAAPSVATENAPAGEASTTEAGVAGGPATEARAAATISSFADRSARRPSFCSMRSKRPSMRSTGMLSDPPPTPCIRSVCPKGEAADAAGKRRGPSGNGGTLAAGGSPGRGPQKGPVSSVPRGPLAPPGGSSSSPMKKCSACFPACAPFAWRPPVCCVSRFPLRRNKHRKQKQQQQRHREANRNTAQSRRTIRLMNRSETRATSKTAVKRTASEPGYPAENTANAAASARSKMLGNLAWTQAETSSRIGFDLARTISKD
mmetsp:Transcript_11189/g.39670  ORF Transcript_11189/g.39670 Transcript_11189/m.39670 type:complete len:432 (-) Transcript_11189:2385-3680(-)